MIYILLILLAFVLLGWDKINSNRRNFKLNRSSSIKLDNKLVQAFDKMLKRNETLYKIKEKTVTKLSITNTTSRRINNAIVLWVTLIVLIIGIALGIILSQVFFMWYAVVLIVSLVMFLAFYLFNTIIGFRLKKIHNQFPVALQVFTDEYITTENIKTSLTSTYQKMPKEIAYLFERLVREITSTYDYHTPIREFADGLGYVWGYAFAELLLISYEGSGDIKEQLVYLNELINEDIRTDEEASSQMATNKTIFIIINIATAIGFTFNIQSNPIGKDIYFYTPIGNNLILIWVVVVVVGIVTSVILDHI